MAQERRLRRARRAGREDDERRVPFPDLAVRLPHRAGQEAQQEDLFDVLGELGDSDGAFHDQVGLLLELHPVTDEGALRHHLPDERPKIDDRRLAEEEVGLRLHLVQAVPDLLGLQAQVQRGDDHADPVAGVDQIDVLLQERQARGDDIPLGKADRQELGREGRDRAVELFPADRLAGVVLDDRRLLGPLLGVEGDIVGDVRQEGFIHPAAAFVLLVVLHGGGLSDGIGATMHVGIDVPEEGRICQGI